MGNARSSPRRCVDTFSMHDKNNDASNPRGGCGCGCGSAWMYAEPLLDRYERKQLQQDQPAVETTLDLPALIHQLNSFFAVLWPVCITMVLSSLVACYATDEQLTQAMTSYMYYQNIDASEKSLSEKSMLALFNGLLVVGFVACLTFAIVLLYKFDCMKLFLGYCIFYCASLLAMAGGKLVVTIFGTKLECIFDSISLWLVLYNFAMVGVLSIFYQKGIPTVIEQGYLVCISVIVAWQLSQLPEWSIWMILLLLGFWDMFAVLTPVGPLRWLVDLVQEKGTPLPGLLFQADIVDSHKDPSAAEATVVQPTQAQLSESEFVQWLLTSSETPAKRAAPPAHVLGFHHQVVVFLRDQHTTIQFRALDITQLYAERQVELWQKLYTYYDVRFVSPTKPYPPAYHVFPTRSPSPRQSIGKQDYQHADEEPERDSSIRLGLGDFIFYSVLVARAAMHGVAAFTACFLCVIIGLATTMYLLAHYDALPALPLSIFSGILAFLVSVELLIPYFQYLTSIGIMTT